MRAREFLYEEASYSDELSSAIVAILINVIERGKKTGEQIGEISTDFLVNKLTAQGFSVDNESIVQILDPGTNGAMSGMVKAITSDVVQLVGGSIDVGDGQDVSSEDKVEDMADKANDLT